MPFTIERNDLASVKADAIVVAANERLQITGGVGMEVALAAGLDELQAACDEIGFCPCGSAVATPAFKLDARIVVHAVGPIWLGGSRGEAELLRDAYDSALGCAASEGARSIALPLISAGTYGFPASVSLAVARESIRAFLNRCEDVEVRLVLYSRESVAAGIEAYLDIAEYIDDRYVEDGFSRASMAPNAPAAQLPRPAAASAQEPRGHRARRRQGLAARLGEAIEGMRAARGKSEADGVYRDAKAGEAVEPAEADWSARAAEVDWNAKAAEFDGGARAAWPVEPAEADWSARAAEADRGASAVCPVESIEAGETVEYAASMPAIAAEPSGPRSLEDLLNSLDEPFSTTLLALIDERGMTDAQVYKRANMSRQLFSKIRSDAGYRPTKKTALALAIALGLDLGETRDLLARAGFTLTRSSKSDVIVEYFIERGDYDILKINEALYAFDQPIL